jgi:drug/metabolite transporter (DMT)-like permease
MNSAQLSERFVLAAAPGVGAAVSFGISDAVAKVVMESGCSVTTLLLFRSLISLAFVAAWLQFRPIARVSRETRWISIGIGILFAGLIYLLYKAIETSDVATAILSYFAYPLLTGFGAALLGLETIRTRGILCAFVALFGLAIMIGARPAGLASVGVAYAIGAAVCRTIILLVTRRYLFGVDAWAITWYSGIATALAFIAGASVTGSLNMPQTAVGWIGLMVVSLGTTAGTFLLFVSVTRIGPFRSALIMQLEPLTATILGAVLIGEIITTIQGVGGIVMLGALTAFQLGQRKPLRRVE